MGVVDAAVELKFARKRVLYTHGTVTCTINMTDLSTYVAPEARHHTYDNTFGIPRRAIPHLKALHMYLTHDFTYDVL